MQCIQKVQSVDILPKKCRTRARACGVGTDMKVEQGRAS